MIIIYHFEMIFALLKNVQITSHLMVSAIDNQNAENGAVFGVIYNEQLIFLGVYST